MVSGAGLLVWCYCSTNEPALLVQNPCVRTIKVALAGPQRLDLRAQKFKTGLEFLDKFEISIGLFIDRTRGILVLIFILFCRHLRYNI